MERLVPEFIRRRFVIQKQKIRPNERSLNPLKKLSAIEAGDLSSAAISKALSPELVRYIWWSSVFCFIILKLQVVFLKVKLNVKFEKKRLRGKKITRDSDEELHFYL